VWTIGTGTTVYPNGVKVKKGDTCTAEQAKTYFKHDLAKFEKTVNESVTVPLNQNQFDALVSLTYNIGSGAFNNSTLLKKLNKRDYQGAADQFLVWNKAGGKVMKGLVRRREAERALFLKK
ncbi:lysozyme, partial [Acinetobacter baumannii]